MKKPGLAGLGATGHQVRTVTGAELPNDLNQVMIVVDGRPPAIGHVQGDAKIKTAKSVEVMGQSRSVLVNIVTR